MSVWTVTLALSGLTCCATTPPAVPPAAVDTTPSASAPPSAAAPAAPCTPLLEPSDLVDAARGMAGEFKLTQWPTRFAEEEGRTPAIRFSPGRTSAGLEAESGRFMPELEKAFRAVGTVEVLPTGPVSPDSDAGPGADAVAPVHLALLEERAPEGLLRLYRFDVELILTATRQKVWIGNHEVQLLCEDRPPAP